MKASRKVKCENGQLKRIVKAFGFLTNIHGKLREASRLAIGLIVCLPAGLCVCVCQSVVRTTG